MAGPVGLAPVRFARGSYSGCRGKPGSTALDYDPDGSGSYCNHPNFNCLPFLTKVLYQRCINRLDKGLIFTQPDCHLFKKEGKVLKQLFLNNLFLTFRLVIS